MRIRILSEGGGIGDLLQRFGVVRSIKKAKPKSAIWLIVHENLEEWAKLDRAIDQLVVVGQRRAISEEANPKKYPYLTVGAPFDATIDMYDPAAAYESAAFGPVTRNRAESWRYTASAVLGCKLTPQLSQLTTFPHAGVLAALQLQRQFKQRLAFVVGIQPLAHWRSRSINFAQVRGLIKELQRAGAQCVLFHHEPDPVAGWAKELGAITIIGEKPAMLVETVRLCDAMISVDSGFFHLAGLLGVPTVGLFAQTDGETISREYESCQWVTAGLAEREGLGCQFPCYWRTAYGFNHPVCERGCRALHRISPKVVVDTAIKFMLERKGVHLPPEERASRMFSSSYSQA